MKKLLSIILLLTCITTLHAQTDYHITVKGVKVTSLNASNVLGNGTVRYYHAANRIEFINANISYTGNVLVVDENYGKDLLVKFVGTNVLKNTVDYSSVISYATPYKLTLYSDAQGSVSINGGAYGLFAGTNSNSKISIQDLTCDITTAKHGIYALNYVDIYNAKLNIKTTGADSHGIYHGPFAANYLDIRYNSNVTITTPGENSYGIYCSSNSTPRIMSNSTLNISTSTTAAGAFYSYNQPTLSDVHFDTGTNIASSIRYNSNIRGYSNYGSEFVKTLKILPGTYYDFKVNGKEVTSLNMNSIVGNSTVTYSPTTNTLTLNGANFSSTSNAIQLGKNIKINVVGTNSITSSGNGIYSTYPFEITGTGTLNLTSTATNNYAPINLYNNPTLTVSGGVTVNLKGSQYGLKFGKLIVKKSLMNIHGDTEAINSVQSFTFDDSQITYLYYNNMRGMYSNTTYADGTYRIKYDSTTKKFTSEGSPLANVIQDVEIGYRRLGIRIAGIPVDVNNCNDILGNGTIWFAGNVLYARNATVRSSTYAILNETKKELKVYLSGTNSFTNTNGPALQSHYNHAPIRLYGASPEQTHVTFTGYDYGIYASDPISMLALHCVVNTTADNGLGFLAEDGLETTNVKLEINTNGNNSTGFVGYGKIEGNSNVSISANTSGSKGISVKHGDLEVGDCSSVRVLSKEGAISYDDTRNVLIDSTIKINKISTDGSRFFNASSTVRFYGGKLCYYITPCLGVEIGPYFTGIKLAGRKLMTDDTYNILGDYTASFDPLTYTLKFNKTKLQCSPDSVLQPAIEIVKPAKDVTIEVEGRCEFQGGYGLYVDNANVTIKGNSIDDDSEASFSGNVSGASITNTSSLTLDNTYSTFYGTVWGLMGTSSTLNLINSKCYCYCVSQSNGSGSLVDFSQINYDGHVVAQRNSAKIIGGTAYYNYDDAPIVRGSWVMIEPESSGDINGDGKFDINDVKTLHNMILRNAAYDYNADLDRNNRVNIIDLVLLNELLLRNK